MWLSLFLLLNSKCSNESNSNVYLDTGGKPITPNDVTDSLTNGHATENGAVAESVAKTEVSFDPVYTKKYFKKNPKKFASLKL